MPTATSLSPQTGQVTGGTTVTIVGTGMTTATRVDFGPVNSVPFIVIDDAHLRVVSPPGLRPGSVTVRVWWGGSNAALGFTYVDLDPNHVPAGRDRWRLTLHARQFSSQTWQQTIIVQLDSARNRKLTKAWDAAAVLTFDIDGHSADAALIQELAHDVIAWRYDGATNKDVPMFRGIVDAAEDKLDESSHTVTFTCHDYFAMLDRRLFTSPNQVAWLATDQDTTAVNLINQATSNLRTGAGASFGAASYLPLSVTRVAGDGSGRPALSGQLRDLTVQGNATVGTQFDNFAKRANAFDYDVLPVGAPGNGSTTTDALRIFYPSQGVVRPIPLAYGINVAQVQRQLTSADYANYWRTLGNNNSATQSDPQFYGEATTPDAFNLAVGTLMTADQNADVVLQTTLTDVAQGQLGIYGVLLPTYTLTLVPGTYAYGTLNIGDTVPLVITSGRLNVNTTQRIMGLTFDIGDDGQEDVEVVVGRAASSFLDIIDHVRSDVRELSRR